MKLVIGRAEGLEASEFQMKIFVLSRFVPLLTAHFSNLQVPHMTHQGLDSLLYVHQKKTTCDCSGGKAACQ